MCIYVCMYYLHAYVRNEIARRCMHEGSCLVRRIVCMCVCVCLFGGCVCVSISATMRPLSMGECNCIRPPRAPRHPFDLQPYSRIGTSFFLPSRPRVRGSKRTGGQRKAKKCIGIHTVTYTCLAAWATHFVIPGSSIDISGLMTYHLHVKLLSPEKKGILTSGYCFFFFCVCEPTCNNIYNNQLTN